MGHQLMKAPQATALFGLLLILSPPTHPTHELGMVLGVVTARICCLSGKMINYAAVISLKLAVQNHTLMQVHKCWQRCRCDCVPIITIALPYWKQSAATFGSLK